MSERRGLSDERLLVVIFVVLIAVIVLRALRSVLHF
jgi:hypothetical protein